MIDQGLVEQIADRVRVVHPAFARDEFVAAAAEQLTELELKQRFAWIADKLRDFLPDDYPAALEIIGKYS